eukprot:CAMPEP_0183784618 /NCGR_PEP_ID=MMETSP0739-20130205/66078_1 /TAXON_ID=385413 /ORGANISM="Thalassiosira miniscula, Strain CCMP1093" /LENGTH=94 /DNA_ID=CAMNT_0026028591 /DNA_START=787 /DNA_END=1071 /DNA_ORIENTATION=+
MPLILESLFLMERDSLSCLVSGSKMLEDIGRGSGGSSPRQSNGDGAIIELGETDATRGHCFLLNILGMWSLTPERVSAEVVLQVGGATGETIGG